jgi:hypothetical protein
MSGFQYPDLPIRFDELKKAVSWAAEIEAVWIDQDDGGIVREANKPWIELRPKRFTSVGTDEIRNEDLETPLTEGTLDYPRQEVLVSWQQVFFEARFRSRSQQHKMSGWYAGVRFKTRMKSRYALQKWLKPMLFSVADIGDVLNMPDVKVEDDRVEDVAIIEFSLNTVLCESDESGLGTWIDRCLVSSDLDCYTGPELVDEVMGWPDATIVVDSNGTPVVTTNGNLILES